MRKVIERFSGMVDVNSYRAFVGGVKGILSLLIVALLLGLLGGVARTFMDLGLLFHGELEHALRVLLLNTLALLAVIEVFRTVLAYFTEGRVKVTYVVDTIMVVMLTEVMALWFKEAAQGRVLMLASLIAVLGAVRVLAIKISPRGGSEHESQ